MGFFVFFDGFVFVFMYVYFDMYRKGVSDVNFGIFCREVFVVCNLVWVGWCGLIWEMWIIGNIVYN